VFGVKEESKENDEIEAESSSFSSEATTIKIGSEYNEEQDFVDMN